jgi:nitrilase
MEETIMKKYTAAVVQAASVPFNVQSSTEKAVRLIHEAAAKGAKLIIFPEAFISGYPKGGTFGATVGLRTTEGRDAFREYYEGSVEVPSPVTAQLGEAAAAAQAYVVIGVIEREAGTLYCCVLFFGPDGAFLGKHRKLMPTAAERLIWGFGDGSTLPVFDTPIGNIGAVICWENYMPMLRMAMFSKGVTIYCAPTADDRDTWASSMQHIALEGRCYVLSACQFIRRDDFPEHYEVACDDAVLMRGGSVIVGPLGKVLAGPNFEGECILTAEIDQDEVIRGKLDFDVVGHYARPDIFRLEINEVPQRPVVVRQRRGT